MTYTKDIRRTMAAALIGLFSLATLFSYADASFPYYGTKIGTLKRLHHGVSGDVYAVDSRTIFIKKFNYDGEAPAAYFYVGTSNKPSNDGAVRLRDERGGNTALTRRYRNKDITLSLPDGKTLRDFKWFSVWCDEFAVNFGDVAVPNNLDFPRPQKISSLTGVHDVSSENIVIVDAQTLLVPNFSYDGDAPDAKFWVGRGQRPTPQGLRIPDENGTENPLRRYDRKTIVLTLPGDLTIFDIGHFGVWCEAFTVDFGHVNIPEGLNVPPSLKMLGISPQSKLNCEVLYDDLAFEVRWAVAGESIVIQLVAKLDDNQYMSFGISPSNDRSVMVGSDVVVAWVDKSTGKGYAQDYYLDDKSQCSGKRGSCPDVNIQDNTNSVRLLNAAMVNGYSIVTYQRSLQATDRLDLPISVNGSEAIVWALGPLNQRKETSFHTQYTKRTHLIDFGRQPTWSCPMPEGSKSTTDESAEEEEEEEQRDTLVNGYPANKPTTKTNVPEEEFYDNRAQALQRPNSSNRLVSSTSRPVPTPKPVNSIGAWDIPAIQCYEPEDGVFYAQMGPTGGKHGYPAITGHVGWGISWYINGLLIPEIHVVRGKTYTFVVEGGNNPDIPAKYHPFYITDDPVGGYEHKREEEKKTIRIFAGVHRSRSGQVTPIGVGRLCNWTPDVDGPPADDYQSFGAYQRTLTLKCDPGEPGVITWKPDHKTPDTVYYHCFTHRYLGWKIHVHDTCDGDRYAGAASEKHEIRVPLKEDDVVAESSIRHETKVSPNDNFLLKHQTDLIKNHNMNGTPPKLTFEITKSSEITKLISDGIRAAEALEESILRNVNNNNHNKVATHSSSQNQQHPLNKSPANILEQSAAASVPGAQSHLSPTEETIPLKPHISPVAVPEILHGESHISHPYHNSQSQLHIQSSSSSSAQKILHSPLPHLTHPHHHHHHPNNLTNLPLQSQKTIGLSEYLRPPQNAPLFHPVKLPGRRPYPVPLKKIVLPQQLPRPSVIVNHYRKTPPGALKSFFNEKPYPIQPLAASGSVLLLGQPTELGGNQRKSESSIVPVPYGDLVPQGNLQSNVFTSGSLNIKKDKKPTPNQPVKLPNHLPDKIKPITLSVPVPTLGSASVPPVLFKTPFDVHAVEEEPTLLEIASMKPAVNNGFKPDSVVIESGFRPILRRDGVSIVELPLDQVAHRREDPGLEIDEVMETDTLFLTAQKGTQTQHFEPMFIPSPPDSTNGTVIVRKVAPLPPLMLRKPTPLVSSDLPAAAKLRDPALNDLLEEDMLLNEEVTIPDDCSSEQQNSNEINNKMQTDNKQEPEKTNEKDHESLKGNEQEIANVTKTESEMESRHKQENVIKTEGEQLEKKDNITIGEINDEVDLDLESEFDGVEEFQDWAWSEEEGEKEAEAAERIDTYYLPPDNRKIPHSNIPSGAVVTYDGKSVALDSSLVLPPKFDTVGSAGSARNHNRGLSNIEQLIRSTPQFGPFLGEIPPSVSEFLSTERSLSQGSPIKRITDYANPNPVFRSGSSSSSSSVSHISHLLPSSPLRPKTTKLHITNNST